MFIVRIFFMLLAIGPIATPANASWFENIVNYFSKPVSAKPPKIRVLVVHDQEGAVIEVKGKYKIYDPHTGDHITTRFIGKRKYMQAVRDGIKWGEEFPGVYQLLIVPDESTTTTLVDGVEYRGPLYVYDIGGTISIVNEVPIESYLSSTLAQRYTKKLPEEFLAALAIAARTNAYYAAANPKNQYWSVDAHSSNYQANATIDQSNDVEKAIKDTRFMIMSSSNSGNSKINPFPAEWKTEPVNYNQPYISKITFDQAEELAKKGEDASKILMKAFPGIKIELINHSQENK